MKIPRALIFLTGIILLHGCTTATYGNGLQPVSGTDNEYLFKVYIGGFSGAKEADARAIPEITHFMHAQGFSEYQIVSRRFNFIPSYYEYHIRFQDDGMSRDPNKQ